MALITFLFMVLCNGVKKKVLRLHGICFCIVLKGDIILKLSDKCNGLLWTGFQYWIGKETLQMP